jgi:hypothetical protein
MPISHPLAASHRLSIRHSNINYPICGVDTNFFNTPSTEHVKWLYKPFRERKVQLCREWTPEASYTPQSVSFLHHGVVCAKDRVYHQKLHTMVAGAAGWNKCQHRTAMHRILPGRCFVHKHACHIQSRCVSRHKVDRRV